MAIENFGVNTLIIPMDAAYQNNGMWRAYGLVHYLLSDIDYLAPAPYPSKPIIPVKWAIQSGKAFNGTDFTASAVDFQTATPINNHNYSGGPYIIDSAFEAQASLFIAAWQTVNPNVKVHIATAPFVADIAATMGRAPRIAVEAANSGIVTAYLNAAGIPDSLGNTWSNASPDIISETEAAQGALFGYDLTACRRPAYDIFVSPHTGTGVWDDPGLKVELNDFLYLGGMLHAMCESIPSVENEAGPFLTLAGIDDSDKNGGDTGTFTVDIPDFPVAQAVNTTNPQGTPGGSVETWLNANQNYNPQTQVIAHFTENGAQYDFMIAGPYKNGVGAGKVVYEGGHSYSTSLPYTGNMENMYTRFVLNDLFFAVGKPLMYLEFSPTTIFQNVNNTITFSAVNTGASPATGTGFSVTLAPGVSYNVGSASIPPTSIVGQTLTWSPASLGNVPPGTVLTFTADYQPPGLGPTQVAQFSTSFGDEFNENYSLNDVCVEANVEQFETAELDVVKTVDLAYAEQGDTLTYTVAITNNGILPAQNVIFTDPIPAGASFVPDSVTITVPPGLPVPLPGVDPSVGIPLPDIPPAPAPGSNVIITFQVLVDDLVPPIDIVNQAFVDYSFTNLQGTFDATAESNTVITQVEIGEITAIKSADKSVATVCDTITYTVVVTNTGTVTTDNVYFRDTAPNGTSFVPGSVTVDGNPVPGDPGTPPGIPLGSIPVGGSVTVIFQVHVDFIPPPPPEPPIAANTAFVDFTYRVNPQGPDLDGLGTSNPEITQLVTPELSVAKSADKTVADLGETITYTVTVMNTGDVTAEDVVLTDPVPPGTSFVPGSVTVDGNPALGADPNVGIPLGDIPPGGSVTVTIQVTATSVPVPNPTTNIATASGLFTIEPTEPPRPLDFDSNPVDVQIEDAVLTAVKSVDKAFAQVCENLTYTVVVTNTGTIVANNVVLTDNPPNGTSFVPGSVTVNGFPVPGADPSLGIPLGNIPPGGSVTVTFQVHVDFVPVPNPTINIGTIDAEFPVDPLSPIKKSFDTNPVDTRVEIAELDIVKAVNMAFAEVGDTLTYTVTVTNTGTVPANNVIVTDPPPTGTSFVPGTVRINGVLSPAADPNVGINIGNIPVGGSKTITFNVHVDFLPVPNPIENIANVTGVFPVDPQNPIEKAFESNPVETLIKTVVIDVVKSVDKEFVEVGNTLTYTVVVSNNGTVNATNVVFTDTPPPGTAFIPGTFKINGVPQLGANPSVGVNLGNISAGGFVTVSFDVTVDSLPPSGDVTNTATVEYDVQIDPQGPVERREEPSNPVTSQVEVGELDVLKSVDKAFIEVGDTLTYTVVITNTGTVPATNVTFNDPPPAGTTFIPGTFRINGVPQPGADPNGFVNLGTLAPGASVTVSFDITVDILPPSPSTVINTANVFFEVQIDPQEPPEPREQPSNPVTSQVELVELEGVKSVDKAFVEVGDTLTYTVDINNTGTVDATNVIFNDSAPVGTTFIPGTFRINGVPQPGADPNLGVNIGSIPAGGSKTVSFDVTVVALPPGNLIINSASIDFDVQIDPGLPPETRTIITNVVTTEAEIGEITVVKSTNKPFVEVGDTLTYTVVVSNTGTVTAENVVLKDTLPPETSFVPGSVKVDGVPQPGASPVSGINLGNIPPGGSKTVTFDVTVDSLPADQIITNTAIAEFDVRIDPNGPVDSRETLSNPVDSQVELAEINVVKTANKDIVEVGDTLTYTVVVTNTGTVNVDNVIFNDSPPVGTTFIPGTFRLNGVIQPGADPNVGVNIGSIPPGGSKTVSFRVTIDVLPPEGQITNTASVDFEFRIDPAGPTQTRTEPSNPLVTEVKLVQLDVIKDVDKAVATIGDILHYTINIANTGTVTAMDVVLNDAIPDGTSFVENSVIVNGIAQPGINPETGVSIGDIAPGGFATVEFSVIVEERPEPPEVVNVAAINFNVQIDPEGPIDDRTEDSEPIITAIEIVELTAVKTADKSNVKVGDILTYTIAITNTGTLPVENVVFKDQIPEGTKLVANSLKVDGIIQPGANLNIGVPIGTIQPGVTIIVTFSVAIEFAPCPPELINMATITFDYRLESTGPLESDSITSNEIITDVGLAILKQFSVEEYLTIPPQKPDIEDILEITAEVEIVETRVIKTPIVISYEGQRLTGWKMLVEGMLEQKVVYIADVPSQSVHLAEFKVPFSTFLVLPEDFKECQRIRAVGYIEDVYVKQLDARNIFKNVTLRVVGVQDCS